jgi:hypothetical protein
MANSTGHGGKTNTRIVLLRSNPVDPDSRVEKEVNSLTGAGYEVENRVTAIHIIIIPKLSIKV